MIWCQRQKCRPINASLRHCFAVKATFTGPVRR